MGKTGIFLQGEAARRIFAYKFMFKHFKIVRLSQIVLENSRKKF
jgi:hypothetical protein